MDLYYEGKGKSVFVREGAWIEEGTGEVPVVYKKKMTDHVVESTFELSAFMKGEFSL